MGRAGELGELERALDAARAGRGAAVLVAGEAGIGKTRLAAELARRAREAGSRPCSAARSIWSAPSCPTSRSPRPCARLLGIPRRRAAAADAPAGSQLRVFEETLALLTGRAAAAPVLLVLEDLHWADTSTLDLVVFLAHNLAERPVVLLATYRADEPASAGRMRRLADGVRRSGSAPRARTRPARAGELTALLAARAGPRCPPR